MPLSRLDIPTRAATFSQQSMIRASGRLFELQTTEDAAIEEVEPTLFDAQQELLEAMELASVPEDYFRARLMLEASALFMIPAIRSSLDAVALRSGLRNIRRSLIQLTQEILYELTKTERGDSNLALSGAAHETAIIAACTVPEMVYKGYVMVPAYPWQNDQTISTLNQPDIEQGNTSIDAILIPLAVNLEEQGVQIKTNRRPHKPYGPDVFVLYCNDIAGVVRKKPPKGITINPTDSHMAQLLVQENMEQSEVAAKAIYREFTRRFERHKRKVRTQRVEEIMAHMALSA